MAIQCLDDPATIQQKEWCISALSKDLTDAALHLIDYKTHQCQTPPCKTLKTVHQLKFNVVAHTCESHAAQPLNGIIKVDKLVAVFDQDGLHRGFNPGRKNLREIFWMTKVDMLPSPLRARAESSIASFPILTATRISRRNSA